VGILTLPQEHEAKSNIAEYLLVVGVVLAGLKKECRRLLFGTARILGDPHEQKKPCLDFGGGLGPQEAALSFKILQRLSRLMGIY
jgi:hypothetical protein